MKDKLQKFIDKFGVMGLLYLTISPIIVSSTTPIRLIQLLWRCKVLLDVKKWDEYNSFIPYKGINYLFYWTQAVNFNKYGRRGTSPTVGLGDFKLSQWWHLSLPSTYMYWRMSNFTVLFSLFIWLISFYFWAHTMPMTYVVTTIFVVACSSTFYKLIESQNYNAVGWMFFPLGLYALYTKNLLLASLVWFLMSFGSFTAVCFAGIITIISSIYFVSLIPCFAFIPAYIKLLSHFLFLGNVSDFWQAIATTCKALGISKKKVKYYRKSNIFNLNTIGITASILIFTITSIIINGFSLFILILIILLILWNLNQSAIFRFADVQSFYVVFLSVSTSEIIINFSWPLLIAFIISFNISPFFLGFGTIQKLTIVPLLKPFHVKPIIDKVENFLYVVKKHNKVLFCFDNPQNLYSNIFDGYRRILEVPLFIASKNEFHVFPNWSSVAEINMDKSKLAFWGRSEKEIRENIKIWSPDYIVLYDTEQNPLDIISYGYQLIATLDWSNMITYFNNEIPYEKIDHPRWYLLKV